MGEMQSAFGAHVICRPPIIRRKYLLIAITAALFMSPIASSKSVAKDLNLHRLTCADLSKADMTSFYIWLDGYRAGLSGSGRSDESWMQHLSQALPRECEENPKVNLLPLIEEMIRRH